jgi:hypothetical protein
LWNNVDYSIISVLMKQRADETDCTSP